MNHPDYNHSELPWHLSDKGKAWKAKGWYQLPYTDTLDNSTWAAPPIPKRTKTLSHHNKSWVRQDKGGQSFTSQTQSESESSTPITEEMDVDKDPVFIYSLYDNTSVFDHIHDSNHIESNTTIPFIISSSGKRFQVNAFLDTGALASNYISERLANLLRASGNLGISCSTKICSPVTDQCHIDLNNKRFNFNLIHDSANINQSVSAVILPSKYDLIISRDTIKKLRLIEVFAYHFLPEEDKKLTNKKGQKRLHQMLGRDRRSCHLPTNTADLSISTWISATLALLEDGETPLKLKRVVTMMKLRNTVMMHHGI